MSSISSTDLAEYSANVEASAELELTVVGLGSGKCSSSCRAGKRKVRLAEDGVAMTTKDSAAVVIAMIRFHCTGEVQTQGILRAAGIKPNAKEINVKQLDAVVDIFHNILNIIDFPMMY